MATGANAKKKKVFLKPYCKIPWKLQILVCIVSEM